LGRVVRDRHTDIPKSLQAQFGKEIHRDLKELVRPTKPRHPSTEREGGRILGGARIIRCRIAKFGAVFQLPRGRQAWTRVDARPESDAVFCQQEPKVLDRHWRRIDFSKEKSTGNAPLEAAVGAW
jgi:hypothetical protein